MALNGIVNLGVGAQEGKAHILTVTKPEIQLNFAVQTAGQGPRRSGRSRNPPPTDGRSRAALTIQLPANAIVDEYDLIITATRAAFIKAIEVADMRVADGDETALVVDFGTMVTVNSIRLPSTPAAKISVYPWLGTKFDDEPVEESAIDNGPPYLFSMPEIRTERLRIKLNSASEVASAVTDLELSLPELPSGLSLTINGGAPVWDHAAMVQLGSSQELDDQGWTEDGKRQISIADALNEFVGDATESESLDLDLVLSSQVSGKLNIETSVTEIRQLHRLNFEGREEINLEFEREGEFQFNLEAPEGASPQVSGVQLSLKGEFPLERGLPPLGPDSNGLSELVLGNGRAAIVRLDGGKDLAFLSGVRIPLETESSSVEARVVLWRDEGGIPLEAMSEGVSEPLNWSGSGEQWITFLFAEPVPLNPTAPLWAAIIVNRGEVIWKMSVANVDNDFPLRIGSPEGPWRALPAVFGSSTSLGQVGGRVHLIGLADEAEPLAPLLISLQDGPDNQAITPTEDGLRMQLDIFEDRNDKSLNSTGSKTDTGIPPSKFDSFADQKDKSADFTDSKKDLGVPSGRLLKLLSRSSGTVILSEVDVITEGTIS